MKVIFTQSQQPVKTRRVLNLDVGRRRPTTVYVNPSQPDLTAISMHFREEYPNAPKGEGRFRSTRDRNGNVYTWMSGEGAHFQIEAALKALFGIDANQNMSMIQEDRHVAQPGLEQSHTNTTNIR